MRNFQFLTVY